MGEKVVKFILKRFVQMIFILFIASILIFAMIRISPSDPIASMTKGKKISEETRQSLTEEYYLDKSYPEQYVIWIKNIFKGDLGKSFQYRQSVNSLLADRLPTTLQVVLMSAVIALILAVPIGIISAVKMNTIVDLSLIHI